MTQRPFHDPVRTRHAVVYGSALGLRKASAITGVLPSQISAWRRKLERLTGETFPRLPSPGNTGKGKLSLAKARQIRARRAAGVSWGVLARIHHVSPTTIVKVCKGLLYPEPAAPAESRAVAA